jgi:hypothetical protein
LINAVSHIFFSVTFHGLIREEEIRLFRYLKAKTNDKKNDMDLLGSENIGVGA